MSFSSVSKNVQYLVKTESNNVDYYPKSEVINGVKMRLIQLRIWTHLAHLILKKISSFSQFKYVLKQIIAVRSAGMGKIRLRKYVKNENQYSFTMYVPAWPSLKFDQFINTEIDHLLHLNNKQHPLNFIFLSVTKKCPLNCEHCFEWDIMQQPEVLSLNDLKQIVSQFVEKGITSLFLTGGEPLSRYSELVELINFSASKCKVWIFTSGYSLSKERAIEMKNVGLTGVMVSMDHYIEAKHNKFRGNKNSFERAKKAVEYAHRAGLLTAISICVTREFISIENLQKYMDFALELKVDFVQFFEPKPAGKYKKVDVKLSPSQLELLERFFLGFNNDLKNNKYPTIIYQGHHQRKIGCHGGGHRYLYVDSNGNIQSCPFCPNKMGSFTNGKANYAVGTCSDFRISNSLN